jgi:TolB-like protein
MVIAALMLTLSAPAPASAPVAILPLAGGAAVSERAAATLTESLAAELQRQADVDVVLPRMSATILSSTKPRQEAGCTTDACMAALAAAAGADRLVTGEVAWDGARLVLTLRLLDARTGRALALSERAFPKGTVNDLLGALPGAVAGLVHVQPAQAVAAATSPAPVAEPAPPAKAAAASGSIVVVHYHRRDGRYGPYSLVVWESFQSTAELRRPVSAAGWNVGSGPQGRAPDGTDAFGLFWRIDTSAFRNKRVNFMARQASGWDECGSQPAFFWIVADGPEAWLDVPECELYATREEAERAQGR